MMSTTMPRIEEEAKETIQSPLKPAMEPEPVQPVETAEKQQSGTTNNKMIKKDLDEEDLEEDGAPEESPAAGEVQGRNGWQFSIQPQVRLLDPVLTPPIEESTYHEL